MIIKIGGVNGVETIKKGPYETTLGSGLFADYLVRYGNDENRYFGFM